MGVGSLYFFEYPRDKKFFGEEVWTSGFSQPDANKLDNMAVKTYDSKYKNNKP